MVEYTLTIYLLSFAIGTLFWGRFSDRIGRKPCVLIGLLIFMLGCVGCYFSTSIEILMMNRFIQGFGGSIGSVIGQAICRDAFHGPALGKVYSSIGSALAVFPAVGPIIGGVIAEHGGWPSIFICLIIFAVVLTGLVALFLPETHGVDRGTAFSIRKVALKLVTDKKVLVFGFIVGACNGISFSYFAEGSFYLISLLGFTPTQYGASFIVIAVSAMLGGILSRMLHNTHDSKTIMGYGLIIVFIATGLFSSLTLFHASLSTNLMIAITVISQMITMFGISMAVSNALALALVNYKWCVGTASSLFGFFYYCVISFFTLGMGYLHDGTLIPMPLYFFGISISMLLVRRCI